MRYIVIKDENLIKQIEDYQMFVKAISKVELEREKIVVNALNKYLHKKSFNKDFWPWKKRNSYKIWKNQDGKCYYCKQPVDYKISTLDHKHPVDDSGKVCDLQNVVACCYWCNTDKGRLNDKEYEYKQLANRASGIYPPVPFAGHPSQL